METTHAIRLHKTGDPSVLTWEEIELSPPGPGEVRVRHEAIGLNFIDTYHRTGLYKVSLPTTLGSEAAGIVEALGEGLTEVAVGDRVAYATGPSGSYAERRNLVASALVKVPSAIDSKTAAASLLKGMTAHYLLDIGRVREDKPTILVHAAAGGVGLILCQWAKHFGATVIGTAGTMEKALLAKEHGCDHVILYRSEKVSARVHELTNDRKVDVVFDSVGHDTFHDSLASLRPRGMLVSYGQSSGPIAPFEPRLLAANGSLFFTRPTLYDYVRTREELTRRASELFDAIDKGVVKIRVAQTYALRDAQKAHLDLEARKTTGSSILLP